MEPEAQHVLATQLILNILNIHLAAVSLESEKHAEYCMSRVCRENRCVRVTPGEDGLVLISHDFMQSLFESVACKLTPTNDLLFTMLMMAWRDGNAQL